MISWVKGGLSVLEFGHTPIKLVLNGMGSFHGSILHKLRDDWHLGRLHVERIHGGLPPLIIEVGSLGEMHRLTSP